jgi:SPP1 family phage portal protein
MFTFQDLEAVGLSEKDRIDFVREAINSFRRTEDYVVASDAEAYYAKRNVTIEKYQKFLRDVMGRKVPDYFSSNYKLKTAFFRRFVIQQTQYVLSNGVTFEKEETKDKLGLDFDYQLQKAAKKALIDGTAFCFWNLDHLEVFGLADTDKEPGFVPLYDEDNGSLRAGIRYWSSGENIRYTLYELDGYTEYIQKKNKDAAVLKEKQRYVKVTRSTQAGGVEAEMGENYSGFPIIPIYANDLRQSEIIGIRESIDCYDFVKSGLANDIDDTSGFYWTLKNTGGMDDRDLQQFVERMKVVRATVLDPGVEADAHTLEIPTQAREAMLNLLKNDLYEDFQIVNVKDLTSGNKTATEIRAAYQPMDDKCGDFEYQIRDFIHNLFKLIGIEDEPSFKWNRIANQTEETQMVLSAASYLDDEAVLKHLPWLTPEEVDKILERKDAEDAARLNDLAGIETETEEEIDKSAEE